MCVCLSPLCPPPFPCFWNDFVDLCRFSLPSESLANVEFDTKVWGERGWDFAPCCGILHNRARVRIIYCCTLWSFGAKTSKKIRILIKIHRSTAEQGLYMCMCVSMCLCGVSMCSSDSCDLNRIQNMSSLSL